MILFKKILLFLVVGLTSSVVHSGWDALNMPKGVSLISNEVYELHMIILWICVAIGVVVFGAMAWSIFMHRKSRGFKPATFHESTKLEVVWTIVPFLILILMSIPATKTLIKMYDYSNAEMTIKVTGYQWLWQYEYLESGVSFYSNLKTSYDEIYNKKEKNINYLQEVDNNLVLPINKKVRYLITSNDVLHAWWIPDLALKSDAIPGFINELSTIILETGVYRGKCAELCGRSHGFMPIVIEAVDDKTFENWLASKKGNTNLANR